MGASLLIAIAMLIGPVADPAAGPIADQHAVTVSTTAAIEVETAAVQVTPRPLTAAEAAAKRVDRGDAAAASRHGNGRVPEDLLCPVSFSPGSLLRCDAAAALERAVEAGMPTAQLTDAYRSLAEQRTVAVTRAGYAATPGMSQHGLGLAIDVPAGSMQDWLHAHGDACGWRDWTANVAPEPWHFEFAP